MINLPTLVCIRVLSYRGQVGVQTTHRNSGRRHSEVLDGKDLLAIAQTGTGKTAAFGLPLLQHLTAIKKGRAKPDVRVL